MKFQTKIAINGKGLWNLSNLLWYTSIQFYAAITFYQVIASCLYYLKLKMFTSVAFKRLRYLLYHFLVFKKASVIQLFIYWPLYSATGQFHVRENILIDHLIAYAQPPDAVINHRNHWTTMDTEAIVV